MKLVEGGIDFSKIGINIGSIAYADGMSTLTDAISMNNEIAKQIRSLADDFNLDVYAQKIPAEKKESLPKLLDKQGF